MLKQEWDVQTDLHCIAVALWHLLRDETANPKGGLRVKKEPKCKGFGVCKLRCELRCV